MSTCSRCGASDWHPDNRACTLPDCELVLARVEKRCSAAGIPLTAPGAATVARYLDEERAGDRQPQGLGRVTERAAVHEVQNG